MQNAYIQAKLPTLNLDLPSDSTPVDSSPSEGEPVESVSEPEATFLTVTGRADQSDLVFVTERKLILRPLRTKA